MHKQVDIPYIKGLPGIQGLVVERFRLYRELGGDTPIAVVNDI